MNGITFVTALQIKQRAAFNIAFDGGIELTINDDDNTDQGLDPGTGRSVDAGGCGYTLYKDGIKQDEGHNALLSYLNNFPYTDLVFEIPGKFKVVQIPMTDEERKPKNGYYELHFTGIAS